MVASNKKSSPFHFLTTVASLYRETSYLGDILQSTSVGAKKDIIYICNKIIVV